MAEKLYFNFIHKDTAILVPVPEMTDDIKKDNLVSYGNEYGVMTISIFDEDDSYMITTSRVIWRDLNA